MKKRNINMYDVILKRKKQDNLYLIDDYIISSVLNSNNYSLKFLIAEEIATSMSKDMEIMMNFMVKSILEMMLYGRK